ncbi:hypothetical protein [Tahibacter sp.]|uniref:hypothetical protein n=1 Tax=Tahibacter sp. TaxID=2056211 RepID=UPI0028C41356|nr:hypothetical protein [Tahibacter sp.]
MSKFAEWVVSAFESLTPDRSGIFSDAHAQSMSDWRVKQQAMVTGSGAAAAAIPVAHLATMSADVVFLMNRMSVCAYGIGAIIGGTAQSRDFLEEEDFPNILAVWAGDDDVDNMLTSKMVVDIAAQVGGKMGAKLIGKTIAVAGGVMLGKELSAKVSAKVALKFASKLAAKAAGGFIPFVGAAIGGGINLWFITSIADAADRYYRFKLEVARTA